MNILNDQEFIYALGNFMADGSFYISDRGTRFEFVDGSPYKKELLFSLQHINHIKSIFERLLLKKLPPIAKRGNKYVLKFRSQELSAIFINELKIKPGPKDSIVNIPLLYKNTKLEKIFWIGYLDGDGSIARNSRRIALESTSSKLINSFGDYLKQQKIFYSKYCSKRGDHFSYVILIKTVSFRDFSNKIGFKHPLKAMLLQKKLRDKDFFVNNEMVNYKKYIIDKNLIDYTKIFDESIFLENGLALMRRYGYNKYHIKNIRLKEIVSLLNHSGKNKIEILKEINNYRFKKSKGSMNSIRLPLYFNKDLLEIAKLIRIKVGGISLSKRYTESFNKNFENILNKIETTFDISPKYTSKKEPLFCSGVLSDFFNSLVIDKSKAIKS